MFFEARKLRFLPLGSTCKPIACTANELAPCMPACVDPNRVRSTYRPATQAVARCCPQLTTDRYAALDGVLKDIR